MFTAPRFLFGLFLCISAGVIAASPLDDMFADKNACWGRVYTEKHLLAQPQQTVRAIYLWDDHGQRAHFEQVDLSDEDAAAMGPAAGRLHKRLRLYVQPITDARMRAADVLCTIQENRLVCIGQDGTDGNDRPDIIRLTPGKASIQLDMLLDTWPLLTMEDHLANPTGQARTALKATQSDRVFRLYRLPDNACAAVERSFANTLSTNTDPPVSKRIEVARQSGNRNQGQLCLTGQGAGMQLRLGFDAQAGDSAFPIDEMAWQVEHERISARGQRAQSTLICRAGNYAWRCESRQFDDQTRHDAIEFVEQSGMLVRRPGGAILRGFACLFGRCDTGAAADANARVDIVLTWAPPNACAESERFQR